MLKKLRALLGSSKSAAGGDDASSGGDEAKIQRAARVRVFPLHDVFFELFTEKENPAEVANLSSTGMGLVRETGRFWPQPNALVQGEIVLPNARVPVQAKIVRSTPSIIGCAFVTSDKSEGDRLRSEIEKYFELELSAVRLEAVNPEILKEEHDGHPRLFRASHGSELFLVEKNGALVRFQLSFLGNYLEGAPGQAVKFGFVHGSDKERGKYRESSIIRLTSALPPEVLESAVKFIANVPDLPGTHREAIQKIIQISKR